MRQPTRREALSFMVALSAVATSAEAQVKTNQAQQRMVALPHNEGGRRPWVIDKPMIKFLALRPAHEEKIIGLTILGEDGERYLLDDVLYGMFQVLEKHLRVDRLIR